MALNLDELTEKIVFESEKHHVFLLGICGLGGSGKSSLCKELQGKLKNQAIHFETDWYARYPTNIRRKRIQEALDSKNKNRIEAEENPVNWYDWDALTAGLKTLKENGSIKIESAWNQKTGEKDIDIQFALPETDHTIIIVDGIYLLHQPIRDFLDYTVYIDVPAEATFERTRQRDQHRSSPEYLSYKEDLVRQYDLPYFEQYKDNIDYIYCP